MVLTPQDVANKEFLTVRLREGYDMQEVDQFLDDVEAELRRLYDENDQLRQGLLPPPTETVAGAPGGLESARDAADDARVSDAELRRAARDQSDAPAAALTILTHAQTAADNLIDEAQSRADELITGATEKAEAMVSDATLKSETMVNEATELSETMLGEATERAERLDAETEQRRAELMGDLHREEHELRIRLDDLRAHEREYRSRLVAYHSEQVRRLQEGQTDDVDVEEPLAVDQIGVTGPSEAASAGLSPDPGIGADPLGHDVDGDDQQAGYRPS